MMVIVLKTIPTVVQGRRGVGRGVGRGGGRGGGREGGDLEPGTSQIQRSNH